MDIRTKYDIKEKVFIIDRNEVKEANVYEIEISVKDTNIIYIHYKFMTYKAVGHANDTVIDRPEKEVFKSIQELADHYRNKLIKS